MFDYTNWTILAREKHFFKISHNRIKNKQVFKAWNTCPMKQKQSGRNGSRQTSRIFPGFPPDWPFFFSPFLAPISTLELVSLARGASEVKVARASRGPAISVDFFILLCGLVSVRYENQLPRKPDQKFLFYLSALVFVCIMQPCTFHGGHVPTIFSATNRLHFRP